MIKYYIIPGHIKSKYDGDIHYINENMLMRLYNVNPKECLVLSLDKPYHVKLLEQADTDGIKILKPRYHGDYNV